LSPYERLQFLDLCAGSGAIGCAALSRLPQAHIYFGEIDPTHEATITKNIRENNLEVSRADIRIGDLFEPFKGLQFDVITANPPYIPRNRVLPASVANYEPELALRSGTDGLDLIRRIARELPEHLTKDGVAWIECDSTHATAAWVLFTEQGFKTEIRTDQYGSPRVLVVSYP
jgi:HemK-like putative methylase